MEQTHDLALPHPASNLEAKLAMFATTATIG